VTAHSRSLCGNSASRSTVLDMAMETPCIGNYQTAMNVRILKLCSVNNRFTFSLLFSPAVKRSVRETDHSPPLSGQECVALYLHPNTSSWHGVYLSTGTTLPLPYFTFSRY